jgi:hypothetical protein
MSLIVYFLVIGYCDIVTHSAYFYLEGSNNESFFIGKSEQQLDAVAFGMIGTSLSGNCECSGWWAAAIYYFQIVRLSVGYMVIALY